MWKKLLYLIYFKQAGLITLHDPPKTTEIAKTKKIRGKNNTTVLER